MVLNLVAISQIFILFCTFSNCHAEVKGFLCYEILDLDLSQLNYKNTGFLFVVSKELPYLNPTNYPKRQFRAYILRTTLQVPFSCTFLHYSYHLD